MGLKRIDTRMVRSIAKLLIVCGMLICLGGCGTLRTVSAASLDDRPRVYSGTRLDYHAIVGNTECIETKFKVKPPEHPVLDMPFSLVLDTIVFPLTYPVSLYEALFY